MYQKPTTTARIRPAVEHAAGAREGQQVSRRSAELIEVDDEQEQLAPISAAMMM